MILCVFLQDPLIVETTGGILRGERLSCGLLCNYFSFKGIPYGKAPVGELRFKAPLPHEGWEGIRNANEHTVVCPQNGLGTNIEDEDCLSLNVYTPNTNGRRAVMVWIYGGAFNLGSGDSLIYGPDFIVPEDVVLVTMNYRVGALGFLSTGDEHATGNYGLKDIVLSLKWVQVIEFEFIKRNLFEIKVHQNYLTKNIFRPILLDSVEIQITVRQTNDYARRDVSPLHPMHFFAVTIFGESAGGAAVHYLILSPSAKGLFQKAISQSGSALNPWAYQTHPERIAHQLAKDMNITFTDNADLIRQLREVRPIDMISVTPGVLGFV